MARRKPMQTAAAAPAAAPAAGAASAGTGNSAKIFKGYALTELSAAGLLYNAKAKEIYYKALGPLVKEPWLAKLDGPSSEGQAMKVATDDYVMLYTCKNHDCYDNNVVLLWSGIQNVVYGKVNQKGKSTLIGNPPPAVAVELEKLWKKVHSRRQIVANGEGDDARRLGGDRLAGPAIDRQRFSTSDHHEDPKLLSFTHWAPSGVRLPDPGGRGRREGNPLRLPTVPGLVAVHWAYPLQGAHVIEAGACSKGIHRCQRQRLPPRGMLPAGRCRWLSPAAGRAR